MIESRSLFYPNGPVREPDGKGLFYGASGSREGVLNMLEAHIDALLRCAKQSPNQNHYKPIIQILGTYGVGKTSAIYYALDQGLKKELAEELEEAAGKRKSDLIYDIHISPKENSEQLQEPVTTLLVTWLIKGLNDVQDKFLLGEIISLAIRADKEEDPFTKLDLVLQAIRKMRDIDFQRPAIVILDIQSPNDMNLHKLLHQLKDTGYLVIVELYERTRKRERFGSNYSVEPVQIGPLEVEEAHDLICARHPLLEAKITYPDYCTLRRAELSSCSCCKVKVLSEVGCHPGLLQLICDAMNEASKQKKYLSGEDLILDALDLEIRSSLLSEVDELFKHAGPEYSYYAELSKWEHEGEQPTPGIFESLKDRSFAYGTSGEGESATWGIPKMIARHPTVNRYRSKKPSIQTILYYEARKDQGSDVTQEEESETKGAVKEVLAGEDFTEQDRIRLGNQMNCPINNYQSSVMSVNVSNWVDQMWSDNKALKLLKKMEEMKKDLFGN